MKTAANPADIVPEALQPTAGDSVLQCLPSLHLACRLGSSHDILKALERLRAAATAAAAAAGLADAGLARIPAAVDAGTSPADGGARKTAALLAEALQVADGAGFTPLMHAVQRQFGNLVAELLAMGGHPAYPRLAPSLNSPLHVAALKGDLVSVRHLLSALAMLTATQQQQQQSPQHSGRYVEETSVSTLAAPQPGFVPQPQAMQQSQQHSRQEQIQARKRQQQQQQQAERGPLPPKTTLTAAGAAPVDLLSANGSTPLMYACGAGHVGVAAMLLRAGADPCRANDDGVTPLMAAASGGHPHVLQLLIRTLRGSQRQRKPEEAAAAAEAQMEPIEAAIVCGPGPAGGSGVGNPEVSYQRTGRTADNGNPDTSAVKAACVAASPLRAAVAAADINGSTALHYAARRGCNSSLALLLEAIAPALGVTAVGMEPSAAQPAPSRSESCGPSAPSTSATSTPAEEQDEMETRADAGAEVEVLPLQLLRGRNQGGRDVLAEARLSGDEATIQLVEAWLRPPSAASMGRAGAAAPSSTGGTGPPSSAPPGFQSTPDSPSPLLPQPRPQQHQRKHKQEQQQQQQQRGEAPPDQHVSVKTQVRGQPQNGRPGDVRQYGSAVPPGEPQKAQERALQPAQPPLQPSQPSLQPPQLPQPLSPCLKDQVGSREAGQEADTAGSWKAVVSRRTKASTTPANTAAEAAAAATPDADDGRITKTARTGTGNGNGAPKPRTAACPVAPVPRSCKEPGGFAADRDFGTEERGWPDGRCRVDGGRKVGERGLETRMGLAPDVAGAEGITTVAVAVVNGVQTMSAAAAATAAEGTDAVQEGLTASSAAPWEAEAVRLMQAALPAGSDLELQPRHLCGLGLGELSAAQLEGLEGLHRAALARISEARLALAVGVEVARVEEDHRRRLEIRAMYEPGPGLAP